ncbi:MAG: ATP-binding protein [Vicinamibacteria bacterium]|nr:ATP-binding protein [Vicinamibacteria bacterium]
MAVLALLPHENLLPLAIDQTDLLAALAQLAGTALERVRLLAEQEQTRLAIEREQLRSTLLSSVSHDLRTPLAAITGASTSLLENKAIDAPARRDLLTTIQEEAERLNRLVGNLLEMTRLESGRLQLQRDWCSLEEIVGGALERALGRAHTHRIVTALPGDLPLVLADGVLLEQLLVNLIDNAVKYGGHDSTVTIEARSRADSLHIDVFDDGPGIAPGTEERIFEKFFRGANDTRGAGLGLAICRAIVAAHGGGIRAENRRPHGVCFHIELPIGGTPPEAPDAPGAGDPP